MDSFREVAWKPLWCPHPMAPSTIWISIHEIQGNKTLCIVFRLALKCITPGKPSEDIPGEKQVFIPSHSLKTQGKLLPHLIPMGLVILPSVCSETTETETKQSSYNESTMPRKRVWDGNGTKSH